VQRIINVQSRYKRDTSDQSKSSNSFARDVVSKAVSSVQKNVTEARSVTKIFENEEIQKHGFDNRQGKEHVVGIYRWVDKKYEAQVFNFGKRMMFEFIVPEPAPFFVESRLRGFEMAVESPVQPDVPTPKTVQLDFKASDITADKFAELRLKYKLDDLAPYPANDKRIAFKDGASGSAFFSEKDIDGEAKAYAKNFMTKPDAKGYQVTHIWVDGYIQFRGKSNTEGQNAPEKEKNTFEVIIDGTVTARDRNNDSEWWTYSPSAELPFIDSRPLGEDVSLTLLF
jgi:hypothetical protein